jgi:multicomponent Na+:H+ antiporter subunit E
MSQKESIRGRALIATWLAVMWVLLWGDLTVVNVLTGVLVAIGVVLVFPPWVTNDDPFVVRPLPALSFLVWFLKALVITNWTVAKEVLLPSGRQEIRTAIVGVQLKTLSGRLATIVANAITLTPGTLTVDARGRPAVLYVHFLTYEDRPSAIEEVEDLERRVVMAFGTAAEVERVFNPAPPVEEEDEDTGWGR